MINQQLVDYIKQQLQAGVAKDVVRKALVDAGWPVADIDDSLKVGEPVTSPAAVGPVAQPTINPAVAMGGVDPIAKQAAMAAAVGSAKSGVGEKFFAQSSALQMKHDDDEHPAVKKFVVMLVVMGVVILLLAAALAFTYFNLNGQLSAAQQSGSGSSGQMAAVQGQVQQLTADNASLTAQVASLTATGTELTNELSFFATPAPVTTASSSATSTPPVAAPVAAVVQGKLYSLNSVQQPFLMTAYNVKIYVANYKDAKVSAALAPLYNSTSTVQLSGTHAIASPNLTVTAVNGVAL